MVGEFRIFGGAVALAAALGGFGLLLAGDGMPAVAAPVSAPPTPAVMAAMTEKPAVDCTRQAWPYVARECLSAAEGTPTRKVARTITTAGR